MNGGGRKVGDSGKLQQLPPMALRARNIILRAAYYISVSEFPASTNGTSNFQPRIRAKRANVLGQQRLRQKQRYQNSKHQMT
jgi:hypothetical protein